MRKSASLEACVGSIAAVVAAEGDGSTCVGLDANHTESTSKQETANANRGEGTIHLHELRAGTSAATRARTAASNDADGAMGGSSSSTPHSARYSAARCAQAPQASRCASTSRRSAALAFPSKYAIHFVSSFSQFIVTSFPRRISVTHFPAPRPRKS
jgi:hypothetical protein